MKKFVSILMALLICMLGCVPALARSIEKINYSKYPGVLSGTFEKVWSKGTVPQFHDSEVHAAMEVRLRLKGNSSANCKVGVGVRRYSGSKKSIVSYAVKNFNDSNTSNNYIDYPSSTSTYIVYGEDSFFPSAGTYAYVVKSTGPSSLSGAYAGFMSDRQG